ncbi:hypothetical protein [Nonomuraea jabiensis]|uniref:hypothetical protein n=1 Tax=Nonomuraea jabiensis TaxID=882448 RepID=UPI003D73854F
MPASEESYAYSWGVRDTDDGGNSWSLAAYVRSLHDAIMVFWVSNHAYRQGRWNLEDRASDLTLGIMNRTRSAAA